MNSQKTIVDEAEETFIASPQNSQKKQSVEMEKHIKGWKIQTAFTDSISRISVISENSDFSCQSITEIQQISNPEYTGQNVMQNFNKRLSIFDKYTPEISQNEFQSLNFGFKTKEQFRKKPYEEGDFNSIEDKFRDLHTPLKEKRVICGSLLGSTESQQQNTLFLQQSYQQGINGLIHYLIDGFSDPLKELHIQNMQTLWMNEEKWRFKNLLKLNVQEVIGKILSQNLSGYGICKIIMLLSMHSSGYDIFSSFGQNINLLIIEYIRSRSRIRQNSNENTHSISNNTLVQQDALIFMSQIIEKLRFVSMHLYLPAILETEEKAVESHLRVIASSLKTIIEHFPLELNEISSFLVLFFKQAYPINPHSLFRRKDAIHFGIIIKKLFKYLIFPLTFINKTLQHSLTQAILNQFIPSSCIIT